MEKKFPAWLKKEENYAPPKGQERFIEKSILSLLTRLNTFRSQYKNETPLFFGVSFLLLYEIFTILLISLAQHVFFPAAILALQLCLLCLVNGNKILAILKPPFYAAAFTFFIVLPALLQQGGHGLLLPFKVFVTVLGVTLFSHYVPFYRVTRALGRLKMPPVFILVFDLTISYIGLLGAAALELLIALKLRSLGNGSRKYKSTGGILGTTFLKAHEYGQQTYEAMLCRGFSGQYRHAEKYRFAKRQLIEALIFALTFLLFLYLEGMM